MASKSIVIEQSENIRAFKDLFATLTLKLSAYKPPNRVKTQILGAPMWQITSTGQEGPSERIELLGTNLVMDLCLRRQTPPDTREAIAVKKVRRADASTVIKRDTSLVIALI
ncbi:hypothetical protein PanWU01x14_341660 [Parasponia andersonii]|uniref:Uncharacterized protein n=1 Tax=Parasponia andersonii TaxID=3476 RepID=A0A2P5AE37_PARAD|nr:hypothetical protein PanWU01x14_341660 [Parasponia andersonii]